MQILQLERSNVKLGLSGCKWTTAKYVGTGPTVCYWQSVSRDDVDKARILLELLFVRLGNFRLSNFDVHSLIVALCTERPSGLCG